MLASTPWCSMLRSNPNKEVVLKLFLTSSNSIGLCIVHSLIKMSARLLIRLLKISMECLCQVSWGSRGIWPHQLLSHNLTKKSIGYNINSKKISGSNKSPICTRVNKIHSLRFQTPNYRPPLLTLSMPREMPKVPPLSVWCTDLMDKWMRSVEIRLSLSITSCTMECWNLSRPKWPARYSWMAILTILIESQRRVPKPSQRSVPTTHSRWLRMMFQFFQEMAKVTPFWDFIDLVVSQHPLAAIKKLCLLSSSKMTWPRKSLRLFSIMCQVCPLRTTVSLEWNNLL